MFEDFDRQVSIFSESVARSISRRKVLTTSIKGVVVTIAGATIGTFVDLKDVFAAGCTCNWYDGSGNANCPKHPGCNPTGAAGCPSGCSTCTSSDYCLDSKGYYCNYSSGSWIS